MNRLPLATILLALLVGCTNQPVHQAKDGTSPYRVGSLLQLTRDLTIPPGHARVFFQHGEIISKERLDGYNPSCDLEVKTLSDAPRLVHQDSFYITGIESGLEPVVQQRPVQTAAFGWRSRRLWNSGPSIHRYIRMNVHSDAQPQVIRLTCRGGWDSYNAARFPSAMEMRVTLGQILIPTATADQPPRTSVPKTTHTND
jgi:hypothetical protein